MKYLVLLPSFLILLSCAEQVKKTEKSEIDKIKEIHEKVITMDTHDDINVKNFTRAKNYTQRPPTQVNIPKMEEGGLDVA